MYKIVLAMAGSIGHKGGVKTNRAANLRAPAPTGDPALLRRRHETADAWRAAWDKDRADPSLPALLEAKRAAEEAHVASYPRLAR